DLRIVQAPPQDGGDGDGQKDQALTDHEGSIAPADRRWCMPLSGSQSHVACADVYCQRKDRTGSTRPTSRLPRSAAYLLEASLRPVSSSTTLRKRCGDDVKI